MPSKSAAAAWDLQNHSRLRVSQIHISQDSVGPRLWGSFPVNLSFPGQRPCAMLCGLWSDCGRCAMAPRPPSSPALYSRLHFLPLNPLSISISNQMDLAPSSDLVGWKFCTSRTPSRP